MTPNNFLKPCNPRSLSFGGALGEDLIFPHRKELVKSFERREEFLENFKERYYSEYLTSLRERSHNRYQNSWENSIKINDVVLIETPNLSRVNWGMGRVTELFCGKDGKVRSVRLIKPNREYSNHSIKLLYPLELSFDEEERSKFLANIEPESPVSCRPKRKAALLASRRFND